MKTRVFSAKRHRIKGLRPQEGYNGAKKKGRRRESQGETRTMQPFVFLLATFEMQGQSQQSRFQKSRMINISTINVE